MTRLAEARTVWYSGKLGWRSGVRASARRSPPVSAMIGRLNLRGPETARTRLPASCPWIRKAQSRVDAGPSSTATRQRGGPCAPGLRRNGPPRARASRRGHLLRPGESWSKSVVPYTHHTTNGTGWQCSPAAATGCTAFPSRLVEVQQHVEAPAAMERCIPSIASIGGSQAPPWCRNRLRGPQRPHADAHCSST